MTTITETVSNTTTATAFKKVLHPADENVSYNKQRTRFVPVFAKVEYSADGRLSISGVVGPRSNGNCAGSCGQIIMSFKEYDKRGSMTLDELRLAPGWTRAKLRRFFDVWDRWHLNDMSPMCEHQRGAGWDNSKELTIYHFRLSPEVQRFKQNTEQRAAAAIKSGSVFQPTEDETEVANLPSEIKHYSPELSEDAARFYVPNGPQYTNDHYNRASETKTAGWVYPSEHPEGLLTKPCPECGYKYGSAWRKEDVPEEVLEFLRSLPSTDKTPAWV